VGGYGAAGAVRRLDRLAGGGVLDACGEALEAAFADDPAVYVVKSVRGRAWLGPLDGREDAELARRWGAHLATAVTRTIERDRGDGANVVRFEDQAEYVVRFVVDLVGGEAWSRWFYGPFTALRSRPIGDALAGVLLEHRPILPRIVELLHRGRCLEEVLRALDPASRRRIWTEGMAGRLELGRGEARPLVVAALGVIDGLGIWKGPPPSADAVLDGYLGTSPEVPDWGDPRRMADAVLEVVRWLSGRGNLAPPTSGEDVGALIGEALHGIDWVDAARLAAGVRSTLGEARPSSPPSALPPRGAVRTPALREALAAIRTVFDGSVRMDAVEPDSSANALRLYAALIARDQRWRDDPGVTGLIESILGAWASARRSAGPGHALQWIRESLSRASEGADPALGSPAQAVGSILEFGQPGIEIIEVLEGAVAHSIQSLATDCAGLFLLVRAISDARLIGLAERVGLFSSADAGAASLLMGVGLRWAGRAGQCGGRVDRGLAWLSGSMEEPPTLAAIGRAWAGVPENAHRALREALLADSPEGGTAFQRTSRSMRWGRLGNREADQTTLLAAGVLLRRWARWLPGFGESSAQFLLDRFIRRRGRLSLEGNCLIVALEPRSLDVVAEMAGYLAPAEGVPWLGGRTVDIQIRAM
jgi:hypothetical protein